MIAICFYTSDSYEQLQKVAEDQSSLCDTYVEWLVKFTQAINHMNEGGISPVPFTVDINDLEKWCRKNKVKNTGANRARYASEMAKQSAERMEIIKRN